MEKAKKIKIRLHEGGFMPEQHGDFIDLATAEEVTIKAGEFTYINLGISVGLPDGYYAELLPRSSTCKKHGVLQGNSVGIIDHDYCGDNDVWKFPAVAFMDTTIPAGTRICQFRLVECPPAVEFEQVEHLDAPDRGGLGSTGEKAQA